MIDDWKGALRLGRRVELELDVVGHQNLKRCRNGLSSSGTVPENR